jgi:hypothetical protein
VLSRGGAERGSATQQWSLRELPREARFNHLPELTSLLGSAREGAQLLFDWLPLPGQAASAMHEGIQVCWHSPPSLMNSSIGVSATKRFSLSPNPHASAMASKGPANSLLNSRQGARQARKGFGRLLAH